MKLLFLILLLLLFACHLGVPQKHNLFTHCNINNCGERKQRGSGKSVGDKWKID